MFPTPNTQSDAKLRWDQSINHSHPALVKFSISGQSNPVKWMIDGAGGWHGSQHCKYSGMMNGDLMKRGRVQHTALHSAQW